jgi:hypothetical protein
LSREKNAFFARELRPEMFIHLDDAAIQSAFTSLTLRFHLRRGGTAQRPYGADVISVKRRYEMNGTKVLGLAAIAAVLMVASPVQRAGAVSLINPGAASAVQDDTRQLTTEVRWGHHHHHGAIADGTVGIIATGTADIGEAEVETGPRCGLVFRSRCLDRVLGCTADGGLNGCFR